MKPPQRLDDFLEHITEAIDRATTYLESIPHLDAFVTNYQAQDAVVRNIEIIGEAVNKITNVSPDFVKSHPEIPWAKMRGMRNVAIHEYFFVDLPIVWTTVKDDFPKLKQGIESLLKRRTEES